MAEALTLETLTPKQLGKHLRAVRRRKGLSQSEVARGAGLTRRELNAYEKGRIPIPDSDMFVLAGSCGVDVSELRVAPSTPELETASPTDKPAPAGADLPMPSSIEDTVAQLRQSLEVAPPTVPAVTGRRRARAIEAASAPAPAPAPAEDDWSIARIDPLEAVQWPGDASIASPATSTTPAPAEPVDVFAELARLPEPSPLPNDGTNDIDLFAALPELLTPPPPGAVEDVDAQSYDEWPTFEADYKSDFEPDDSDEDQSESVLVEMPNAQATIADLTNAADAPPIDVAMRGESYTSPWDSLQSTSGFETPTDTPYGDESLRAPWETPAEFTPDPESAPGVTDAWEPVRPTWDQPWSEQPPVVATPDTDPAPFDVHADDGWTTETTDAVDVATPAEVFDPRFATAAPFETVPGPWAHEPDPEATSTGFYIDWGDLEADGPVAIEPGPAWDPLTPRPVGEPAAEPEPEVDTYQPDTYEPDTGEPAPIELHTVDVETDLEVELEAVDDSEEELPLISWRPQWDDSPEPTIGAVAFAVDEPPVPEPEPEEQFVVAGAEWVLGNAVPLVEVRGTGSLVMRRADERWALADVTAASDFALEAYVDLRSGSGFGLLFRAVVDDDGRMSGYSFDVDPVYEGGSYLVREWRADRELWNPIARVPAPDPEGMRGLLAVRLTVHDDRLVASVNGEVVLEVDSLKQGSADRGREGASGNRVGIQAWSSTDLVIDELRVAQR